MPTELEVARAILCIQSLATGEGINVNIDSLGTGTSNVQGLTISGDNVPVPSGWSSFSILNWASSTENVTTGYGALLPPGAGVAHDTYPGFPGEGFVVVAPADATVTVTWVIPTATP